MSKAIEFEKENFWEKFVRYGYGFKKNTSLKKAVEYSVELFRLAEDSIWFVGGSLDAELWANPEVIEALTAAKDRNVEIRIIFGPMLDPENNAIRDFWRKYKDEYDDDDRVHLYKLGYRPQSQFTVVDGKHVRVEEPHIPRQPRRAWVRHNTLMLARRLELDFTALVSQAVEMTQEDQL